MIGCSDLERALADPRAGAEGAIGPALRRHLASCARCAELAAAMATADRALADLARPPLPRLPPFDGMRAAARSAARRQRLRATGRRASPWLALGCAAAGLAIFAMARPVRLRHVQPGEVIEAERGAQRASLNSGAVFTLESGRARVGGPAPRDELFLERGSISLEVPVLPPGSSLCVRTADADVVVHGTRFRVERSQEGTRVSVAAGSVEVKPDGAGRPPFILAAGASAQVEPLDSYRTRLREEARDALGRGDRQRAGAALASLRATEPGGLLEGEALSLSGLMKHADGDQDGAAADYRGALALAPREVRLPWAESAAAELAILEESRGAAAGASAWRDYLSRFPSGRHADLASARLRRLERR